MSETARAVGRQRTTSIMEYIPLWSSNVELILRWDVCVVIMKDIIYKCYRYRAESDTLRFTAYDKMASSRRPSRPDQTLQNMDYYTFAWNQKGPNNVFRVGWYVCGRTKMKDYIRRNETDVPAIWWIQVNMASEKTMKAMKPTGPLHRIDRPDRRLLRQC